MQVSDLLDLALEDGCFAEKPVEPGMAALKLCCIFSACCPPSPSPASVVRKLLICPHLSTPGSRQALGIRQGAKVKQAILSSIGSCCGTLGLFLLQFTARVRLSDFHAS